MPKRLLPPAALAAEADDDQGHGAADPHAWQSLANGKIHVASIAEGEASAADVARPIRQVREQRIPAVFVENISDPRLIEQITRETGARVGGALHSGALPGASGPAPTYLAMFRHDLRMLLAALTA